jgi:glycosyltransferase involved in cell wall biosynthesis
MMERDYDARFVREIPTGVDTQYFRPSAAAEPDPEHLVFTGSMDWLPNDDAMTYFAKAILPRIRASCPQAVLTIVGRKPFPSVTALSRKDPQIRVTGQVDDVRSYIERAAVYVIPLRIGGGTRLKVFEAMAMEKAIVSTSIGVEGLPIVNGTDAIVADEPDAFADAVIRLLRDRALSRRLGVAAAMKVRAQFGWAPVAASFIDVCELARRRWKHKQEQPDAHWEVPTADAAPDVKPQQLSMS